MIKSNFWSKLIIYIDYSISVNSKEKYKLELQKCIFY